MGGEWKVGRYAGALCFGYIAAACFHKRLMGEWAGAKDEPSRTAREASIPAIAEENAWRESYHGA
jgi:hypothetical protein